MKTKNIERRRLGSTNCQVGVIVQGTWYLEAGRAAAIAIGRRTLDLGMSHVDRAEYYGEAENVSQIGKEL